MQERFSVSEVLNKCDILLEGEVISNELILKTLIDFMNKSMVENDHSSSIVLHTGSKCYDAVLVTYAVISCLCYNSAEVSDVFDSINVGDLVVLRGSSKQTRYEYLGYGENPCTKETSIVLNDKGNKSYIPLSRKDKITPYYGESKSTGTKGLRKSDNVLRKFYSDIVNTNADDIAGLIDTSAVLVMKRELAEFYYDNVSIRSKENKSIVIPIRQLVTASYYTTSEDTYQIGSNINKAEAILQITSNIGVAERLIKEKSGNKKIGVIIFDEEMIWKSESEVPRLIKKRSSSKFSCISLRIDSTISKQILSDNPESDAFICTKDFLLSNSRPATQNTAYVLDLDFQIATVINREVETVVLDCDYDDFIICKEIRNNLHLLKQSEIESDDIFSFVKIARSLLNLFQSATFEIHAMEKLIDEGKLNVSSPKIRFDLLNDIIIRMNLDGFPEDNYMKKIVSLLKQIYESTKRNCAKEQYIRTFISKHPNDRIAIVVPKDYYVQIMKHLRLSAFSRYESNVQYFNATKFYCHNYFNYIISVSDTYGKRFDALECNSAMNTIVLLYESEKNFFSNRKKYKKLQDNEYNSRSTIPVEVDEEIIVEENEKKNNSLTQEEINKYLEDEKYWRRMEYLNSEKNASYYGGSSSTVVDAKYFVVFEDGETCFFTKNYQPYVYNYEKKIISDTIPLDQLSEGDTIIFTATGSATKDIVDDIIKNRINESRYPETFINNYKMSRIWRDALIEKRYNNPDKKAREIAREIKALGLSVEISTICNWMNIESHIVGPQKADVLSIVGKYIGNDDMNQNYEKYFNAIKIVKRERQKILDGIQSSIIQSIGGEKIDPKSDFADIPEKLQELASILTISSITETNREISAHIANRPLE